MSLPHLQIHRAQLSDQQRWDAYVLNHPDGSPYHLFAWKRAVEEAYHHHCPYLFAEHNNQLVGVLPLVQIRLPGVMNQLVALPYCDMGNCLSDTDEIQDLLLDALLTMQGNLKCGKVNLRGTLRETLLKNKEFHAEITGKVSMVLHLPPSSEQLWASFKSKLRSQIHKAEKNGITFSWSNQEHIDEVYSVFCKNMHELGSPVHSRHWLDRILMHFGQRAKVGLVHSQNNVVGMGLLLLGQQSVSIPWASTLRASNHLGPNMLLYWNLLQFSADNGFKHFDFGRATIDEGTYKFKKQWGAEPRPLPWYSNKAAYREPHHPAQRFDKRALCGSLWKKLPLLAANTLGPHIRKFISL